MDEAGAIAMTLMVAASLLCIVVALKSRRDAKDSKAEARTSRQVKDQAIIDRDNALQRLKIMDENPPTWHVRIHVKKGKRGIWRWQHEDCHGKTRYLSPVQGWKSAEEAEADASESLPVATLTFVRQPRGA